jgi:hypothetical protein
MKVTFLFYIFANNPKEARKKAVKTTAANTRYLRANKFFRGLIKAAEC